MDSFAKQAVARQQSLWLQGGFLLVVAVFVATVDLALLWVISRHPPLAAVRQMPRVTALIAFGLAAGLASCCWRKACELRQGGSAVAYSLGGSPVVAASSDPLEHQLLNVVEEMALAARMPQPRVFVLRQEAGINAFAAGRRPEDAVIAVTQGALQRLNREELQAVIGHEFSHVLNGDMALNLRMIVWLHGLYAITAVARQTIANRGTAKGLRDRRAMLVAVAFAALGSVGLLLGRVLQAAVSRRREVLADASSVQFTHNSAALTQALLKIAGSVDGARIESPAATGAAHLFFCAGDLSWVTRLGSWFATHPPIAERIRALDATFDKSRLAPLAAQAGKAADALALQSAAARDGSAISVSPLSMQHGASRSQISTAADARLPWTPAGQLSLSLAGSPTELLTLDTLQARLPVAQQQAIAQLAVQFQAQPQRTSALVIAALLPRELQERRSALQQLARVSGGKALPAIAAAARVLQTAPEIAHWPSLLNLLPELNAIEGAQRDKLLMIVRFLCRPAQQPQMLRYCVAYLLAHGSAQTTTPAALNLTDCAAAIATLFAALAYAGDADFHSAAHAYDIGIQAVLPPTLRPPFSQPGAQWMMQLDAAFRQLKNLHPMACRTLSSGMATIVAHDGVLTVPEAELLRLACWVMATPLPALPVAPQESSAAALR